MTVTGIWPHLDQRTGRLQHVGISVGGESSAEEGGSEVDGDGGEPDHEEAECDALRGVAPHLPHLQLPLLQLRGDHRRGVQHRGQEVHLGSFHIEDTMVSRREIGTYRVIKRIGPVLTNVYCTLIFHNIIID